MNKRYKYNFRFGGARVSYVNINTNENDSSFYRYYIVNTTSYVSLAYRSDRHHYSHLFDTRVYK